MKNMYLTTAIVSLSTLLAGCAAQDNFRKPVSGTPTIPETSMVHTIDGTVLNAYGVNFQTPISWEANRLAKAGIKKTAEELNRVTDNNIEDVVLMGASLLRCHLTPADFTDSEGNLCETIYLDALDYMVHRARQENLTVSFALLNHMGQNGPGSGWAGKGAQTWIHDPAVVSCTKNYISQLLNHRNKYSGEAYKDMSHIAYWELVNEPLMYSCSEIRSTGYCGLYLDWLEENSMDDNVSSYAKYRTELVKTYIDTMYNTIRNCGARHPVCWGLNWHRYRTDNADIFTGAAASKAEIVAFCNYPGQDYVGKDYQNESHNFTGRSFTEWFNKYHDSINGYGWAISDDFSGKAKIVYEFETFFNQSAYLYPVQALYFRSLEAQAASMWTYTFNEIAPYFGGSHFLNLRYTPAKAASFIVASHIFKNTHPDKGIRITDEMRGGDWCISRTHNAAVYCDSDWYCHSGATDSGWCDIVPPETIRHVRGIGNSPVAEYSGNGIYFIDETGEGLQILLMPDVKITGDQFSRPDYITPVTQLINDTANKFLIHLNKWASAEYMLYDISEEERIPVSEVKGSEELSLKPGKYLLIAK